MGTATRPRPFVHVNCAASADGRLAFAGGRRARLSGPDDLARVQRLRADCGAILVGVGTVLADDPSLRVHWDRLHEPPGREPLRVVLDSRGRTPESARVLGDGSATLVATALGCRRAFPPGVEVFAAGSARVDLPALLAELSRRGVERLLVEGGSEVIASFLRAGLVDRFTVYLAPVVIGGSTAPPIARGPESMDASGWLPLSLHAAERLGPGLLVTWVPAPGGP
jgi:2,5-diamino-6-(ribosylamino)-4(3H)-pyrimidinone 5'-phosphate reductase